MALQRLMISSKAVAVCGPDSEILGVADFDEHPLDVCLEEELSLKESVSKWRCFATKPLPIFLRLIRKDC